MLDMNDAEIRLALIDWLNQKKIAPQKILNEVTISDGLARPDLIAIYSYSHCYEIKGDNDQIQRIVKQYAHYQSSFKKNILVTTQKHLKKALGLIPNFWGIIVAMNENEIIKFKYVRKSSHNPFYRKDIASKILWKSEMQQLLEKKDINFKASSTRNDLIDLINTCYTSYELDQSICIRLLNRKVS